MQGHCYGRVVGLVMLDQILKESGQKRLSNSNGGLLILKASFIKLPR